MAVIRQAPSADRGYVRWLATGEVRHLEHSPPLPQKRATPGRTGPSVAKANRNLNARNVGQRHAVVNTQREGTGA